MRELLAAGRLGELAQARARAHPVSPTRSTAAPSPTRRRSSASGSTTRTTPPRPASSRRRFPPSSPSSATRCVPTARPSPCPPSSRKVDYEAEVAFVIGTRRRSVEAEALDHVAGYTLLNDLSARDLQFATPQWMPGKVFDGSAPCGPALVTADEAGDPDAIGIALDLNGERMQEETTAELIFSSPSSSLTSRR